MRAYTPGNNADDAFAAMLDNNGSILSPIPQATTVAATNVTSTIATLNGTVDGVGGTDTIWLGFYYGQS